MTGRTVMHLDMDAYFASVEQQCNPALRGKPIAVIGSGARTVVTAASYEARKSGVKTGMTVFEVRQNRTFGQRPPEYLRPSTHAGILGR